MVHKLQQLSCSKYSVLPAQLLKQGVLYCDIIEGPLDSASVYTYIECNISYGTTRHGTFHVTTGHFSGWSSSCIYNMLRDLTLVGDNSTWTYTTYYKHKLTQIMTPGWYKVSMQNSRSIHQIETCFVSALKLFHSVAVQHTKFSPLLPILLSVTM